MLSTLVSYSIISRDIERSLGNTAKQPMVARESEYFLENIQSVKSIEDFLGDDRLFAYAMKANGLSDMTYAKAFMRKVLKEGIDSSDAFANTLVDKRYREFADTFNFARYGSSATVFEKAQQGTVDKYVRQTLEEDAGQQNEGVRLALYFQRQAPNITSIMSILADKALMQVADTALGIPSSVAAGDIDKHAEMIADKLDLEDLKDPEALGKLLTRFATLWEIQNPSNAATSPSILISGPIETGVGMSLLASIQNLRLGGN